MLVPALLYKEELLKKFTAEMYSDRYFWYTGYMHEHALPNIGDHENVYQYAILSEGQIIGYFGYRVDPACSCVESFGLYAFDDKNYNAFRNALTLGRDIYEKMNELANTYHRVSWRVVSGNPVVNSYDNICKELDKQDHLTGTSVRLHDVTKDRYGNYHDEIIYEIINRSK